MLFLVNIFFILIHRKDKTMNKIHPIVVGTKVFDKSMMTYQYGNGQEYTIPIYCLYIEGGDRKILVDTGEMNPKYTPIVIITT